MPSAVTPTTLPTGVFSATVLTAALLSDRTTGLSLTLVTAIAKSLEVTLPSLEVALTVMVWLVAAS
ncbi:MAG: hypothetical protein H6R10_3788 [Rhodocyclaceae bacterium]|nr:hypothetical protein [Rhodocyclaceae bacterium]